MKVSLKAVKKSIPLIIATISLFLNTGWIFSDASPYIKINCTLGNNVIIYLNASSADNKLYYDDTNHLLINMSGSSQAGYIERNGIQYQITFPVYDTPYYRTSNYDYVYITGVEIVELHKVNLYSQYDTQFLIMCGMLTITFLTFLKRGN